jgi:dTDP-4-amino-4,6-dideoxygalactose transaminase
MITFNKPYLSGEELNYIKDAVTRGKISGNGHYTQKCHDFFQNKYGFTKCLLTTSCTDALEMAAILCNIQSGDEVIVPSFSFVSTANAFVLRGAKIVFADSRADNPGIDEGMIESLITPRTKVIVPVHYAGVACDMDYIMDIAKRHNLLVVEDAAQAIDSFYKGRPLGGIGHFGCFSFHETKNIQCGEGGMLVINDDRFSKRAEIIWEKGTNRAEFFRGEINKYGWVDVGSSFLPSEVVAAFLWAQIEKLDEIQDRRKYLWNLYSEGLKPLSDNSHFKLPAIPQYATNNAHLFYLVCHSIEERSRLIKHFKLNNVQAVFHYLSLHSSDYYVDKHDDRLLPNCDLFADCLVRLPLYYELREDQVNEIVKLLEQLYL